MTIIFAFLTIFCLLFPKGNATPLAADTLLLTQVLFRHGDRSPSHPYPTDPNNGYWTEGIGQLTNEGKEQHYELGQYFRSRYSGFLNGSYYYENVYAQSSETDRCLMSVTCNLAGLYPPMSDEVWNPAFPWQPIPVHTMPVDEDYWMDHDAPCPNYDTLLDEQKNSDEMKDIDNTYADLYTLMTMETGETVNSIFDVSDIYDATYCDLTHGLTIPSWITPDVLQRMEDCHNMDYAWKSKTTDMQRLRGGATLGLMVDYMKNKQNGDIPGLQIALWSTHESMVSAVLYCLEVANGLSIPYAASLIMELHLQDGNFLVQMFYRNETTHEPYEVALPGCPSPCPYDTFHDLTDGVTPGDDIATECGA